MKKLRWMIGTSFLGAALLFGFSSMTLSIYADDDSYEHEEHKEYRNTKTASAPNNAIYKEECSACHLAYPASLLPEKSWNKIMANLENHFDENAEVDKETNREIKSYLARNALGTRSSKKTRKMLRNFPKHKTPVRITKLPYFIRKHDEVPRRMVVDNPKVKSFSQCDKCHRGAEQGNFNEHQVRIPGYAGWED